MAKVIAELPKKQGGVGRAPKYDYSVWLDGQIWQLEVGDDFEGKPESMRANILNAAKQEGLKVRSRILRNEDEEGIALVIQAYSENEKETNVSDKDETATVASNGNGE